MSIPPDRALAALLAPEDSGEVAPVGKQSLPTLNQRIELLLRAVHGSGRDFSSDERAAARARLLDAMAANFSDDSVDDPAIANLPLASPQVAPAEAKEGLSDRITRLLAPLLFPFTSTLSPQLRFAVASLALLFLTATAWTGFWLYSAGKTEAAIAQWLDREAQAGRMYQCGSRSIGGFPLSLEMRCAEPTIKMALDQSITTASARELRVVASLLKPSTWNAQLVGPVSISEGRQQVLLANWTTAHLTLEGTPSAPKYLSIALVGAQIYRTERVSMQPLLTGDRFEIQARSLSEQANGESVIEISTRVEAGFVPSVEALASQPLLADAKVVLSGMVGSEPMPFHALLRAWQAGGGKLEVKSAHLQQDQAVAEARGILSLNAKGQIEGALRASANGAYVALAEAVMSARQSERPKIAESFQIGPQIQTRSIGRPTEPAPSNNPLLPSPTAPSVRPNAPLDVSIRFADGALYLGTALITTIPALY